MHTICVLLHIHKITANEMAHDHKNTGWIKKSVQNLKQPVDLVVCIEV